MILRINAIRGTSFVAAWVHGWPRMTSFLLIIAAGFHRRRPSSAPTRSLICTLTFLLVYVFLVRDLDNPFEYALGDIGGSAEASLEPLVGLQARLALQLTSQAWTLCS